MALRRWGPALLLALSVELASLSLWSSVQTPAQNQPQQSGAPQTPAQNQSEQSAAPQTPAQNQPQQSGAPQPPTQNQPEQSQPQPQTPAPPSYCPPSPAGQSSGAAPLGQAPAKEVPPKPGEICLICNKPIGEADTVYIVNGQRLPVHRGECDAKLRAELPRVVAQLQPVSGFMGDRPGEGAVSRVWFFAGLYVLLALIFAALCGHRALHKGRRPALWFGLGLVFPVLGYLVLAALPKRAIEAPGGVPGGLHKVAATYRPQSCPKCGRENHPSATRCLGCGAPLVPEVVSEVARVAVHRSG